MRKFKGSLVIALLFIVILFGSMLALTNVVSTLKLGAIPCPNCYPTNPFYPQAGYTNFRNWQFAGVPAITSYTQTQVPINTCASPWQYILCGSSNTVPLYTVSQGTLYVPIGMWGQEYVENYNCGFGGCNTVYWDAQDPPGLPPGACTSPRTQTVACVDVRGLDLTGSVFGANGGILLTAANPAGDPTCTNYSNQSPGSSGQDAKDQNQSTCWAADYATVQAAPTPCTQGVTACLSYKSPTLLSLAASTTYLQSQGKNQTQINAILNGPPMQTPCGSTSLVCQITTQNYYLYRMITAIQFKIVPPAVPVTCQAGSNGVCNPTQCDAFHACPSTADLQSAANLFVNNLNQVDYLPNTRLAFGINVNGLAATSSAGSLPSGTWFGIVGVWVGGQGIQTAGCTNVTYCSFVQTSHTQLALYQDAGYTQPAGVPPVDQLTNLASITNQSIIQVTQQNVYSQIYTYVDTQGLGVQYSPCTSSTCNCNLGNTAGCITTPTPLVVNVPLIYDIIGSYSTFFYQYPGVPPPGGSNSGTISGHVYDASTKNLLGQYTGLVGACVALGSTCTGFSGQLQSPTGNGGSYSISNIPPGPAVVYASAQGYYTQIVPGITVAAGNSQNLDFYLQPTSPPGQWCILPPIPNPVPYQPALFGGLCIPNWVLPVSVGIALAVVAAVVFMTPAGQTLGFAGATALSSRIGARRRS